MCLVCGLLALCVFVYLAYRYVLASSGTAEVELRVEKIAQTPAERSSSKVHDSAKIPEERSSAKVFDFGRIPGDVPAVVISASGTIPARVLSKIGDVSVSEKTATFTVRKQVCLFESEKTFYRLSAYVNACHTMIKR